MKTELNRFTRVCILLLGLDQRVSVRIKKGREFKDAQAGITCGLYCWTGSKHEITVVLGATRGNWQHLLAHEMAHAWVCENHPKASDHGRTFQRTAAALRRGLRDWGYNVTPLYLKGIDK